MDLSSELRISPDSVESYRRDGYAVIRGIASPEEIDACRPVIGGIVRDVAGRGERQGRIDDYSKLFTQVTNIWRLNDAARRIVFSRRFAGVAAQLLGVRAVRLYHDQALFKPPGAGRTPWHQDRYYWPLDTELTVTMWLPLVGVDDAMGPMTFAAGSHRIRIGDDLAISTGTDRRLQSWITEHRWPVRSEPIPVGAATFHSGGTIHSAGANRSDRTREVLTVIYYAAGTRVADPANDNQRVDLEVFIPGAQPGDEAASELNPVLWDGRGARTALSC